MATGVLRMARQCVGPEVEVDCHTVETVFTLIVVQVEVRKGVSSLQLPLVALEDEEVVALLSTHLIEERSPPPRHLCIRP